MHVTTSQRAADVGRGLAALTGVVALVAGVPVALVAWVGWPLPSEAPSLSAVRRALADAYIPDGFLVKVLALLCWLVWFELVVSLVVEAVAYARGRRAGAVPLAGGIQRGAARLIAAVALLGAVAATRGAPHASAPSSVPLATVAVPAPVLVAEVASPAEPGPGPAAPPAAPTGETPAPDAPAPVYEVRHRDTLWDIAEHHLGDPFRWREIFELNEGCPQADGRCLTDPDLIFPGWRLSLPADAVGVAPPADPADHPATPAPGDDCDPGPAGVDSGSSATGGVGGGRSGGGAAEASGSGLGDGMVLVDDGAPPEGDVLVAAGVATATPGDGMVLLPGGPAAAGAPARGADSSDPATAVAAPAPGDRQRDSDRNGDHGDETASGLPAPGATGSWPLGDD